MGITMLNGIKACIFDLDGTLVDSMWMWNDIDVEYLARHGYTIPEDLHVTIEGMSFTETAVYFKERFNIQDSIEVMKEEWNNMARDKYEHEVALKEGVLDLLEYLKRNNVKMGIGTSNSKELLSIISNKYNFQHYFQTIRTACEVEKGKPAPDIYLKCAEDLGVKPEECIVFEDILNGVRAGISAGMKTCGIFDKAAEHLRDELKELADYYIYSYDEIER